MEVVPVGQGQAFPRRGRQPVRHRRPQKLPRVRRALAQPRGQVPPIDRTPAMRVLRKHAESSPRNYTFTPTMNPFRGEESSPLSIALPNVSVILLSSARWLRHRHAVVPGTITPQRSPAASRRASTDRWHAR